MKSFFSLVLSVLFIFTSLNAFAFTASYKQTTIGPGLPKADIRTVMIKDNKIRIDMKSPAREDAVVLIDGNTMYSYVPGRQLAYRMPSNMASNLDAMTDYGRYLKSQNAKVIGSGKSGDYDCDIYEFIDPDTKAYNKVWFWEAKNFPVKFEMTIMGNVMVTEMTDIEVGIPIDDAEFVLPDYLEVREGEGSKQQ